MLADNTAHLLAAATRRSTQTQARATETISTLMKQGHQVSVAEISRTAGVSRSWLYAHPDLLQQIRNQPALPQQVAAPTVQRASDESLRTRLALANQRNREQASEILKLRQQIAVLHGKLREHHTSVPGYGSSGSSEGNSANDSAALP